MRICVYEDRHVRGLEPLTLTRPASDLLCGLTTLGEKQARYFAATAVGHLCRPVVADLIRARDPSRSRQRPGVAARRADGSRQRPLGAAAALAACPAAAARRHLIARAPTRSPTRPYLGTANGAVAFAVLDPQHLEAVSPATLDDCLDDWAQSLPTREVGGTVVARPWELIDLNGPQIARDFEATLRPDRRRLPPDRVRRRRPRRPAAHRPDRAGRSDGRGRHHARPGRDRADAVVHAFTRLEGPCAVGAGTRRCTARRSGPAPRSARTAASAARSSAASSSGYANKYHDGFLGHSYVGEWVNLAAGTHTSDLRCDYRPVSVPVDGVGGADRPDEGRVDRRRPREDGARACCSNCGTAIGPFAQVLPTGGFAPRDDRRRSRRVGPGGAEGVDRRRPAARHRGHRDAAAQALTRARRVYRAVALGKPVRSARCRLRQA